MKAIITICVLSSLLFGAPAMAGSGHDHGHSHAHDPVNKATAEKNASDIIASLLMKNIIENSWASIKATSVEKKAINGSQEWVVIFNNEKISDKEKQTLYVFLSIAGEYIAANYTGK